MHDLAQYLAQKISAPYLARAKWCKCGAMAVGHDIFVGISRLKEQTWRTQQPQQTNHSSGRVDAEPDLRHRQGQGAGMMTGRAKKAQMSRGPEAG